MIRQKRHSQKGYTLVELAIVLVIMGILAAGVTLGRELIEDAKVKSIINDFENFKQAHYLYIKRTGHPPGLSRDADGNFTFDSWGAGRVVVSSPYFNDLIAEGLIPDIDPDDNFVIHAYGGQWFASSRKEFHAYIPGSQICATALPLWAAKAVDYKLDDGNPSTGRILTGSGNANDGSTLTGSYESLEGSFLAKQPRFTTCYAL